MDCLDSCSVPHDDLHFYRDSEISDRRDTRPLKSRVCLQWPEELANDFYFSTVHRLYDWRLVTVPVTVNNHNCHWEKPCRYWDCDSYDGYDDTSPIAI